jgi:YidC/Oxa1 family membrane protein insertase
MPVRSEHAFRHIIRQEVTLAEIRNPNQQGGGGGGSDPRTMLLFSVAFLCIFLGLQYWKSKKAPPPTNPAPIATQSAQPSASPSPTAPPATPSAVSPSPAPVAAAANDVAAQSESQTVVENELYRITFSNRGAQVTSWILKKWKDDSGKPLDLVNHAAALKNGFPLSLYTYDAALRSRLASALFVPSTSGTLIAPGELTYTYASGSLTVKKTFKFDASYVIHVSASVTNNGSQVPALISWPSALGDQSTLPEYASGQFDTSLNGKFDNIAPKKVSSGSTINGQFDYAGISDSYFAAIFLPDTPDSSMVIGFNSQLAIERDPKRPESGTSPAPVLGAAIGNTSSGDINTRLFAGPKDIDVLNSVRATALNGMQNGPNIEPIIEFGYIGLVAKPLFFALRFTHDHIVANWGWAILILTLIINIAMLPTRVTMMKSAMKMQRIQPEMNKIKERYKQYKATDPKRQEMNAEVMALQKREGVNMFGGCLPMLIQYPLLFGFYRMLMHVIELRQAHWLWLHDLAMPDPTHILPIFVIVSMFLVQYLSPSPGMDPAQQKTMAFMMPAFFGFMMWNFASGLALYWAAGNLINVGQQMVMNRSKMGREMKELAAKRTARKLGKPAASRR